MTELNRDYYYREFLKLREHIAQCMEKITPATTLYNARGLKITKDFFDVIPVEFRSDYSHCLSCLSFIEHAGGLFYIDRVIDKPKSVLFGKLTDTIWDSFIARLNSKLVKLDISLSNSSDSTGDLVVLAPQIESVIGCKDCSSFKHLYIDVPKHVIEHNTADMYKTIAKTTLLAEVFKLLESINFNDLCTFTFAIDDHLINTDGISPLLSELKHLGKLADDCRYVRNKGGVKNLVAARLFDEPLPVLTSNPVIVSCISHGVDVYNKTNDVQYSLDAIEASVRNKIALNTMSAENITDDIIQEYGEWLIDNGYIVLDNDEVVSSSLERSYAKIDDIDFKWKSKVKSDSTKYILPPGEHHKQCTWVWFVNNVLPTLTTIAVMPTALDQYSYVCFTNATFPDSKPILKWDKLGKRNNLSMISPGVILSPDKLGLSVDKMYNVSGICKLPHIADKELGYEGDVLVLADATNVFTAGTGLFEDILVPDLNGRITSLLSSTDMLNGERNKAVLGISLTPGVNSCVLYTVNVLGKVRCYRIINYANIRNK